MGSSAADRLLEAARGGNASAFWQLADGYRPYLKTLAVRVLGDQLPADGSDVVQNGLLLASEHFSQFQGAHAAVFLGWLVAIVRNEGLKCLRRRRPQQPLPQGSSGEEQLAADSSGPDQKAERREEVAGLLAALARLPEDSRTVIDLRNLQELPFDKVARQMGRSNEAVRQLWTRAFRRLQEEMGELR